MAPILELRNITKAFPGVLANDHINVALNQGEILALLGENGAGKTTLMNILYGLYTPDSGEIFIRGHKAEIKGPHDAIAQGIGMVHQHFMLVPVFTVTENVMLGNETVRNGVFLDRERVAQQVREISSQYGLDVDPDAYISDLPVGVQQRVEIIKVLYRQAEILVLDEPTSVLTPQEADGLFRILELLVKDGKSIIFITHKLKEVMKAADRVTVLRGGRVMGSAPRAKVNEQKLAEMMVGREVNLVILKRKASPKAVTLEVRNLYVSDDQDHSTVNGVTFSVRAGEILGIAGVQGNGQRELIEALTGLRPVKSGKASILGQDTTDASPRQISEAGSAHVPEDRQKDGLVLSFSVADNLVLNTYYQAPFTTGFTLHHNEIERAAAMRVEQFDVRTPGTAVPVANLSGGNQQKVIIARELSRPIKLLIASQPTRGLDVGSIEYIHGQILKKRDEGCAVLLVSSELDEIMALSDKIGVMYAGRLLGVLPAEQATREKLGLLMAGYQDGEPPGGGNGKNLTVR